MRIDARDMACPRPVVLAMGALPKLAPGEALEVLVNDGVALGNLRRLAGEKGCAFKEEPCGADTVAVLTPGAATAPVPGADAADAAEVAGERVDCPLGAPTPDAPVIAIGSDTMGRGDDVLGAKLLSGLIFALSQGEPAPRTMIFFNGGARLTCTGSPCLDDIRVLAERGTEVLTCGTCLDFYGIADQLEVGGVTNLYHIAEVLACEPRVVTL